MAVEILATKCPQCGSTADSRITWGIPNLARFLVNVVWFGLQLCGQVLADALFTDVHDGWPLKRRCRRCGCMYMGRFREPPDNRIGPRCDYNLTGNVSGRCPECGWKLARRYRTYHRRHPSTPVL